MAMSLTLVLQIMLRANWVKSFFVDITTEGEVVAKEEVFGTIEAVKTVSDLFMPVSGESDRSECRVG